MDRLRFASEGDKSETISRLPSRETAAGERGAASRPSIRRNQGRKLGEGVGRNLVGTTTLSLNRLLKEARGHGAVGGTRRLLGPQRARVGLSARFRRLSR